MIKKTVVIYFKTTKESPIQDFLNTLEETKQAKVLRIFKYITNYGLQSIPRHIKKVTNTPLWEIRILGKDNIRILYISKSDNLVLILHGFIKKKQKTPVKEIKIAIGRLEEWNLYKR